MEKGKLMWSKADKTLSLPDLMSYLHGLALRIWASFLRREGSSGMDMSNAPMVRSRELLTYRLDGKRAFGRPKWKQLTQRDCRELKLS